MKTCLSMLSFFTILPCYHRQQGGVSPFGEAETLLSLFYPMYQFTYTVPFGIVASETIFFLTTHSLMKIHVYISFFYALKGGSISAPVIKERKEQNQQGPCTSNKYNKYVSFHNC